MAEPFLSEFCNSIQLFCYRTNTCFKQWNELHHKTKFVRFSLQSGINFVLSKEIWDWLNLVKKKALMVYIEAVNRWSHLQKKVSKHFLKNFMKFNKDILQITKSNFDNVAFLWISILLGLVSYNSRNESYKSLSNLILTAIFKWWHYAIKILRFRRSNNPQAP